MQPELSLVIPAYNEAGHLESVVKEITDALQAAQIKYEICIVNNGSRDATREVIERLKKQDSGITSVHLDTNQQYGGGIQAGLAAVQGNMMGWIHADGQANPKDLVRMYLGMQERGKELGKAVRIQRDESPWRIVQGKIWFAIFRLLFRCPYRDVNATPKLMTRRAANILKLDSHDWFLDPEFVIKALRHNLAIYEVETVWRSRRSGSTRAHLLTGLEFLKNLLLYRFGIK